MKAVILVGHGGVPTDFPRGWLTELKSLEGKRRALGESPSLRETELDQKIRKWPRSPENDPYQAGLETLANQLQPLLGGSQLAVAYNEFCAPSLEEALGEAADYGASQILVIPSMLTAGGVHSEVEIPEALAQLQLVYPNISIRYAWPFDANRTAQMLAEHLSQFH